MTDERMTGDRVIRLGQKPLKLAESCSCYRRPCDQLLRLWARLGLSSRTLTGIRNRVVPLDLPCLALPLTTATSLGGHVHPRTDQARNVYSPRVDMVVRQNILS